MFVLLRKETRGEWEVCSSLRGGDNPVFCTIDEAKFRMNDYMRVYSYLKEDNFRICAVME